MIFVQNKEKISVTEENQSALGSEIETRKGSLDPMKMLRADGKREQS